MRDSENTNETETQRAHFFCRFFLGSGDFDDFEEPDELLLPLLPLPDELPLLLPLPELPELLLLPELLSLSESDEELSESDELSESEEEEEEELSSEELLSVAACSACACACACASMMRLGALARCSRSPSVMPPSPMAVQKLMAKRVFLAESLGKSPSKDGCIAGSARRSLSCLRPRYSATSCQRA